MADRVLVVDDDPRNLLALSALLEQERYEVIGAGSGESALTTLATVPDIGCVLLDIMMPGIDGYEVTRRIRARPSLSGLPVVAVTAKAMPEDEDRCREIGCSAYITKPVDTAELLRIVRSLIAKR